MGGWGMGVVSGGGERGGGEGGGGGSEGGGGEEWVREVRGEGWVGGRGEV
jgi:hypothetical protein